MRKPRDYKAEYARRITSGMGRGLSRSQARGHPKPRERTASQRRKPNKPVYDRRLELGLKRLREGETLTASARSIGVSRERLRRYIAQTRVVRRKGRRWVFRKDRRPRRMPLYSAGEARTVTLPDLEQAAQVGEYMSEVGQFLETNDAAHLAPFVGQSVQDTAGNTYVFETRPNVLYRLDATTPQSFEDIYRILV